MKEKVLKEQVEELLEELKKDRLNIALNLMTDKQQERWQKILRGLSISQIAMIEGVKYISVYNSVNLGLKKIKRVFGINTINRPNK